MQSRYRRALSWLLALALTLSFSGFGNFQTASAEDTEYIITWRVGTSYSTSTTTGVVDLTNTATLDGWTFVGWGLTDDATTALSNLTVTEDTMLCAIFKKTITVKFVQLDGTYTSETAIMYYGSSGNVTAPTITSSVEGWTSLGWCSSSSGYAESYAAAGSTCGVDDDCTFYASYSKSSSTTFHDRSESTQSADSTVYRTSAGYSTRVSEPETEWTTTDSYMKVGWAVSSGSFTYYAADDDGVVTYDGNGTDLYIVEGRAITLTLDSETILTEYVLYNGETEQKATFSLPEVEKEGYDFYGWSINSKTYDYSETTTVDLSTNAAGTSVWTERSYILKLDGNGASVGDDVKTTLLYTQEYYLPANGYQKTYNVTLDANGGYCSESTLTSRATFLGWSTEVSGGTIIEGGTYVSKLATSGTITLYAQWSNADVTLIEPTLDSYDFLGWYNGTTKYEGTISVGEDMTLTATWSPINGNVTIVVNGATNTEDFKIETTHAATVPELQVTPVREYTVTFSYGGLTDSESVTVAYTIDGIYDTDDTTGNKYYDSDLKPLLTWKDGGPTKLYVVWVASSVSFPTTTIDGYTISGWTYEGSAVTDSVFTPTVDCELVAVTAANIYTVTLDANGGTVTSSTVEYTYGTGCTLETPTRDGYIFDGWYDSSGTLYASVSATCYGDLKLTASWTDIADTTFVGDTTLTELTLAEGTTEITEGQFSSCTALTTVTLPSTLTTIGASAFEGCTSLTSIVIPDSVTSIGVAAFDGCTSLKSVTFGSGLTSISRASFRDCTSLSTLSIPENVESIGESAFSGCTGLTTVNMTEGLTEIGVMAFYQCTGLETAGIPKTVIAIGEKAFYGCSSLSSASLSSNLATMGISAFEDCGSLKKVTIPATLLEVPSRAYANASGITKLTFNDGCTTIDEEAFKGCCSLASVALPETIISVQTSAFSGCTSLISLTVNNAQCELSDLGLSSSCTVRGHDPSTAKDYADSYGLTFIATDSTYTMTIYLNTKCTKKNTYSVVTSGGFPEVVDIPNSAGASLTKTFKGFAVKSATGIEAGEKIYDSNGYLTDDWEVLGDITLIPKWKTNSSDSDSESEPGLASKGVGNVVYTVCGKKSATVSKVNRKAKKITIKSKVKINGVSYNVTSISAKAAKDCSKLKSITIKGDGLTSVGKNALKGTSKKLVVYVEADYKTAYKKLFKGKGNANVKVKVTK